MEDAKALWNARQAELKAALSNPNDFEHARELCLTQHALVHEGRMSDQRDTFEDMLWSGLESSAFYTMPSAESDTIAWCLWHCTRIEDITMNLLVSDSTQVFQKSNWQKRMNTSICDTGNAMTYQELAPFSAALNATELRQYRIAVGRKSRELIQQLSFKDVKQKIRPERLQRVLDEGAVLNVPEANWLLDFWGRKNVAGILLMPLTRHHFVHLNEAMRIKKKLARL